jgi:hypothetical protein
MQHPAVTNSTVRMANAESPDPTTDLVPVTKEGEEVDPVAPAPEPKVQTRKDATLKEFLSKMDDYAPIVCLSLSFFIVLLSDTIIRFRMQSRITTSPKLVYPRPRRPMRSWPAS